MMHCSGGTCVAVICRLSSTSLPPRCLLVGDIRPKRLFMLPKALQWRMRGSGAGWGGGTRENAHNSYWQHIWYHTCSAGWQSYFISQRQIRTSASGCNIPTLSSCSDKGVHCTPVGKHGLSPFQTEIPLRSRNLTPKQGRAPFQVKKYR
jgi:hypothetical protein